MEVPDEPRKFTRTPDNWESWLDQVIADAEERGVFKNLPAQGKPLQLSESPFADGRELGYGILKNAGFAPLWVELDKEIRAELESLDALRQRIDELRAAGSEPIPDAQFSVEPPRRRFGFLRGRQSPPPEPRGTQIIAIAEQASLERDYRTRIDAVNKKIGEYNAAIPRDLWWIERQLVVAAAE